MTDEKNIKFTDNEAITNANGRYVSVVVNVAHVLESWKNSVFSFEWLSSEGGIKPLKDLSESEQPKRKNVEEKLVKGIPIEKPILGIGVMENIEIGSGRAEFLTLAAHGIAAIPVHIPKSHESDFKEFLAGVDSQGYERI